MLYMTLKGDGTTPPLHLVVLELGNIEELRKGRPAMSPDGEVMVCFTPDAVWTADRLAGVMQSGGDGAAVAKILEEAAKRPQTPSHRPRHVPYDMKTNQPMTPKEAPDDHQGRPPLSGDAATS